MKTLKILVALCFILGFSTKAVNAQPPIAQMTWDQYWGPVTITPIDNECLTEELVGTFHYKGWWLNTYWQERMTGEFVGQTTNLIYTFEGITTHHFKYNLHEGNWGTAYNEKLRCGGKLIGMIHFNSLTNWVNDEPHIDISNTHISCK
jgi:hypothetical protein